MENNEGKTGLWDVDQTAISKFKPERFAPRTLLVNGIGLGLFSLVFMVIVPYLFIPSTFDPRQFCGVPLIGFVFMQIPVIVYGLIRWLTFPYIRLNAVKFHIAAFAFEMVCIAGIMLPFVGSYLNRTVLSFWFRTPSDCSSMFSCGWFILPLGALIIPVWCFFSMGRIRRRGTGLIAWLCAILYLALLVAYILASMQPSGPSYIIKPNH